MTIKEYIDNMGDIAKQLIAIITIVSMLLGGFSTVLYWQLNKKYATIERLVSNTDELKSSINVLTKEQTSISTNTSLVAYFVLRKEIEKFDLDKLSKWDIDRRNEYLNIHRQLWEAAISSGKLTPTATYRQPF